MLRKLDILVIKAFIGPFAATFFITLLVLVMQFFWLWIDDFVGKGLSTGLIFEFIWYQSAVLVPLALPLAVLLSSLITFGNLGESYELVAVKSAGISLLRFMRPLFFVVGVICGVAFLFSNYIIPVAQLRSRTMLGDIVYAKPAFDIKEGVFYNRIPGFAIKIGKKDEGDSIIHDIIIYEQSTGPQDNFVAAKDGIMRVSENKRFLEFNLQNGWRYQERGTAGLPNSEFIRLGFKEYKKQFDLSTFQLQRTSDSVNKSNWRMLSMRQLAKAIDSLGRRDSLLARRVKSDVLAPVGFTQYIDSNWATAPPVTDTAFLAATKTGVPASLKTSVEASAAAKASTLFASNENFLANLEGEQKELRRYKIEWHRKIVLSLACLVLFMIGAPLGAIIRKGGLGNSMLSAIVFFMIFYFMSNTGEKFSKEGAWPVFAGMWLSTFVLVPLGIFLTYKAVHDSQLFNKEYYTRLMGRLRSVKVKKAG